MSLPPCTAKWKSLLFTDVISLIVPVLIEVSFNVYVESNVILITKGTFVWENIYFKYFNPKKFSGYNIRNHLAVSLKVFFCVSCSSTLDENFKNASFTKLPNIII